MTRPGPLANTLTAGPMSRFKQDSTMSLLSRKPLKSINNFVYLGSNILSTGNDVNICIGIAWTAIDVKKSDRDFFQVVALSGVMYLNFNETSGEKAGWEPHEYAACYFEQILEIALHETATIRPLTSHLTNHTSISNKTCRALLKKKDQNLINVILSAPTHGHTIHKLCVDTRCLLEDLQSVIGDKDGWWERFNGNRAVSMIWW